MNLSITMATGPSQGSVAALEEDEMAEIGSGSQADIIVSDPAMNHLHFVIECGDTGCEVRDLNSHHGTFVNRRRINRHDLADGDEIEAGRTRFRVRLWKSAEVSPVSVRELRLENGPAEVTGILEAIEAPLYAVLDAARSARVLEMLRQYEGGPWQPLYGGQTALDLADYCPYLVSFGGGKGLLADIIAEGWGDSWGIFVSSHADFENLRKHLRRFLMVPDANGDEICFGFYDPRVLRPFLRSCSAVQARSFFGPIDAFHCESTRGQALLNYELSRPSLRRERLQPFGAAQ